MQSQYQHLSYPESPPYSLAAVDAEPNCCACSHCCAPPNCCSRQGRCPCFCNSFVTAFASALSLLWCAVPILVTAIAVPDFFEVSGSWYNNYYGAGIGAFQTCFWWGDGCTSDANSLGGNQAMFDAFRSLLVISLFCVLLSGIVTAVRLAQQQRGGVSQCVEVMTAVCVMSASLTLSASFALATSWPSTMDASYGSNSLGFSWVMMTVAEGLVVTGSIIHLITWRLWVKRNSQPEVGADAVTNFIQPPAFSHPAPAHFYTTQPRYDNSTTTQPPLYQHAAPAPHLLPPTLSTLHGPSLPVHIYRS